MNIAGQQVSFEVTSTEQSKSIPLQSFRGDKARVSYGGGFHINKKPAPPPKPYVAETVHPNDLAERLSLNSAVPPIHIIEKELDRLKQQSLNIQNLRNKQTSETILHLDPPSHRHEREAVQEFSYKNLGLREIEMLKEQNVSRIIELEAELRRSKENESAKKAFEYVPVYRPRNKSPKKPEKLTGHQKEYYEKFEKFAYKKEKQRANKSIESRKAQERYEKHESHEKAEKIIYSKREKSPERITMTESLKPKAIIKTSSSARSLKAEKDPQPTCLIPYKHMAKLEQAFLTLDVHQDFVVPRQELIESMLEDEHIIKILHIDAVRISHFQVLDLESMLLYIKNDGDTSQDLITWNQFQDYFFITPSFEESHFEGMENPKLNEIDLPSRFMALIQEVFESIPKKTHNNVSLFEFVQAVKADTKTSALMNHTARIPEGLSHVPEETVGEVLDRMLETAESLVSWVDVLGFFSKRGLPKDSNIGESLITKNSFVKAKMPKKPVKENCVQTEDVEMKKNSHRSRSISPRGKVTFYENSFAKDVTVPQPFGFEEREKKKTIREKWLEREEKEREEEMNKHLKFQYRARDVPREVSRPKYQALQKALEERSAKVKRESAERTRELEKPFNFYLREKEKVKKELTPPPEYKFKATPIPWACTVSLYETRMREDEALREERKSRAAQQDLRKSSLPPRMEMYEHLKKSEMPRVQTPSPKHKIKEPPNFEKLHERFAKTLEAKKKANQTTAVEPFLIDQRVEENKKKKEEKRKKKEEERKRKEEEDRKKSEEDKKNMVKAKQNWKNEHESIKQRTGRTEKKLSPVKSRDGSKELTPESLRPRGFSQKDLKNPSASMNVLKPQNTKTGTVPNAGKRPATSVTRPSLAPSKDPPKSSRLSERDLAPKQPASKSGFTEKDLAPNKPAAKYGFTEKDLAPGNPPAKSGFTEKDLAPNNPPARSGFTEKDLTPSSSSLAPEKPKSQFPEPNQRSSKPSAFPSFSKPTSKNPLAPDTNNPPAESSSLLAPPSVSSMKNQNSPLAPDRSNLLSPSTASNPLAPSSASNPLAPGSSSDLKPIPEVSKHSLSPNTGPVRSASAKKSSQNPSSTSFLKPDSKEKKYNTLNPLKKHIGAEEQQAAADKGGINEKLRKRKEDAKLQELEYQEKLRAMKENVNRRPLLVESATDSSNKNRSKMKILLSIKKNLEDSGVRYEPYFTEEELTLIQEAEYMSKMNRLK